MLSLSVVVSAASLHERDFQHSGHKTKTNYRYSCVVSAIQRKNTRSRLSQQTNMFVMSDKFQ